MKLQEIRKNKKLSQSQLAEITNISVRTIQHWECEKRNIDGAALETLCTLADALGCKIYDILESEDLIKKLRKTI